MSSIGEYAPLKDDIQVPPRLSHKMLLTTFREFAFNNAAFREGLIDEVTVSSMTGERMGPDRLPTDHIKVSYEFEAARLRSLELVAKKEGAEGVEVQERQELMFCLTVMAVRDAIEMPTHIAMDAYGISDPEEAANSAGSSALEHTISFRISTNNRVLTSNDSYTYKDREGYIVCIATVDEDSNFVFASETGAQDEESVPSYDGPADLLDDAHLELETISNASPDEIINTWEQLHALEQSLGGGFSLAEKEDERLRQAYSSFVIFREGLRRQLGL